MTINVNYNDNVEVTQQDGTNAVLAYLNGNLSGDKTFNVNVSVTDYDLFLSNRDAVTAKIDKFIVDVIDNVVANIGNPMASVTTGSEVE